MTDTTKWNPNENLRNGSEVPEGIDREAIVELMGSRGRDMLRDVLETMRKRVETEIFTNGLYHNQQLSRVQVLVNERNYIDFLINLPKMLTEDQKELEFINRQMELETEREIKRLSE